MWKAFHLKWNGGHPPLAQSLSRLCHSMDCSMLGSSVLHCLPQSLLKFVSIESVMLSNHLILCHSPLFLPSIFPGIRVFSSESALCIRWPKYWSFKLYHQSFQLYSRLISFRTDWFDLLTVQGTLRSLLQHHSSKASVLQHSAFFMLQFSHLYITTGKTTALTIRTFVANMPSYTHVMNFAVQHDIVLITLNW